MTAAEGSAAAHVQVVRGTPDDVELAALVAGLVAAAGAGGDEPDGAWSPRDAWSDRARTVRGTEGTWRTGPDAWRRSLR